MSDRKKWWSDKILHPKGQRSTSLWHHNILQNVWIWMFALLIFNLIPINATNFGCPTGNWLFWSFVPPQVKDVCEAFIYENVLLLCSNIYIWSIVVQHKLIGFADTELHVSAIALPVKLSVGPVNVIKINIQSDVQHYKFHLRAEYRLNKFLLVQNKLKHRFYVWQKKLKTYNECT